jgi:hypothetical protein
MKNLNKIMCVVFLLAIVTALAETSTIRGSISTAQDKTLSFIENVLPISSTQYNITLSNYGIPKLPDLGANNQNTANQEVLTYSLQSKDSSNTADVICTLYNGNLYICQAGPRSGQIITDKAYANTADAAKSFLEKYQTYSKLDSTEMIGMLANVDPTKNSTIASGNLKLTVTHQDLSGTAFGDMIGFNWVQTINDCEYQVAEVAFSDGAFSSFIDQRVRYSVGDTTVNITKDQAIKIAMDYIKNYSYRMSDTLVISDFNVTEDKTVANLTPTVREGNVLYPHWSVTLYLNQTYPGSVTSILLGIWADSGQVFFCHYQAYGGAELPSNSNTGTTTSDSNSNSATTTTTPAPISGQTNVASIDTNTVAVIAIAAIAVVALAVTLIVKKRSK